MQTMLDLLQPLGSTALEAFWWPVLAWTLLTLPFYAAVRRWEEGHPLVHYRVRLALLFALPLGLGLDFWLDFTTPALLLPGVAGEAAALVLSDYRAVPGAPAEAAPAALANGYAWVGLMTVAAAALAVGRSLRLAQHTLALRRYRRVLPRRVDATASRMADRLTRVLGVRRPVRVLIAEQDVVPLTFGWRHPVVVVPATLLDRPDDLRMALLHELVHVRQQDYALQYAEQVLGALFAFHPLVASLRRESARYREMSCDAAVLSDGQCSQRQYAALLYHFVSPSPPTRLGLGMADTHDLKTRIAAMKSYAHLNRFQHPRLVGALVAVLFVASFATLIVACSDLVGVNEAPSAALAPTPPTSPTPPTPPASRALAEGIAFRAYTIVEEMPELIGGLATIQRAIHYPRIAKQAGIQGRVIVQFVVDEEGAVQHPTVVRGIGAGCDEEAVRAVRQARFTPGMQDGQAVPVLMTIPITFTLPDRSASEAY